MRKERWVAALEEDKERANVGLEAAERGQAGVEVVGQPLHHCEEQPQRQAEQTAGGEAEPHSSPSTTE